MTATIVISGILEAIRLGSTLIDKLNKGEMTPEQAAAEWDKTSTQWSAAVDKWHATKAP